MLAQQCISELLKMGCGLRKIKRYTGLKEITSIHILIGKKIKISREQYFLLNGMWMYYQKRKGEKRA